MPAAPLGRARFVGRQLLAETFPPVVCGRPLSGRWREDGESGMVPFVNTRTIGVNMRQFARWSWLVLALAVGVFGASSSAFATPNFGDHGRDNSDHVLRGTRSEIKTPPDEISWGSRTGLIFVARVDAENVVAGDFLAQIGFGETSDASTSLDACGARSTYHRFNEFSNDGVHYTCNWFGPPGTSQNDLYTVARVDAQTGCLTNCWNFVVSGTSVDNEALSHDAVGIVYAGEEFDNCVGCGLAAALHAPAVYGTTGTTDWQRTSNVGGTGWTVINTGSGGTNSDGNWSLGTTPTPFTISHP